MTLFLNFVKLMVSRCSLLSDHKRNVELDPSLDGCVF